MRASEKRRPLQARAALRRQEILSAALDCFTELGFGATTITDICRRSRASTGSVYHLFGSKEGLAAELYVEGVTRYQEGLLRTLGAQPRAREGCYAAARYHLLWAADPSRWAQFLLAAQRTELPTAAETRLVELQRSFWQRINEWTRPHIERRQLRRYAPDLFVSILLGPCREFSRQQLAGLNQSSVEVAARELGRAAWRALAAPRS